MDFCDIIFIFIQYSFKCYYRYDEGFRKTLTTNVPQIEPMLKTLIDDNPLKDVNKKFDEISKSVTGLFKDDQKKAEPKGECEFFIPIVR